ncbi:MAG: hypothetical protein E5V66_29500 [Mesorhizobium sp.]|uniref:hypothetical protein n=1 Tax=Mesorhizobium sp. TaxID=1871066 RepID=UPI0012084B60|nr:hypothetical protein [Mesorhizobium sp.]TIW07813.1 MAG: hypothetical protein E5V66_29500 [Mesorhizobium sp.]
MTSDDSRFKFTSTQLAIVAQSLGVDEQHLDCRQVEWIVAEWRAYREDDVRAELARNSKIAGLAEQLLEELLPGEFEMSEHFDEDGAPVTLVGHLISLQNWIEQVAEEYPRPKGRRPQIPSTLAARLIEFWENTGRRVGRSSKADGDEQASTGPLVRFLVAASSPVLKPSPTADAAASAIRSYVKAATMAEWSTKISSFPPF